MSDAPATIGLVCDGVADWREALTLEASTATYYVRADIAEQRIRELEVALKEKDSCARHCEGAAYRTEAKRLRDLNAELMEAASMGKDEPLLRQALDALQNSAVKHPQQIEQRNNAIVALRERLGESDE